METTFLLSIPPLVKVLAVFGLILILGRLKWPMGAILLIATPILGLWSQMETKAIFISIWNSFKSPYTLSLCFVIVFILVLSRAMREGGQLERIVYAFQNMVGRRHLSIASLPALIGLLPMPGGAIFSAPMIETASMKNGMNSEEKAAANYWFRHIWEYWWPLYPGVILTVALMEIELGKLILKQFPLTAIAIAAGFFLILRKSADDNSRIDLSSICKFVFEVIPVLLVILFFVIFRFLLSISQDISLLRISQNISFLAALVLSTTWVCLINRIPFKKMVALTFNKSNLSMFILGVGIMAFKGILQDSHALVGIKDDLSASAIPTTLVIVFLPFLSGLVTGITVGFVGSSFPLLLSLLPGAPADYIQYIVLAYGCGYTGVLLSPVHICLILTRDYFKANLVGIYKLILAPILSLLAGIILLFFLYGRF
ncbi:DUF401 family protein [candidate division NPL-UPA2 bacterium]|nr:DUF401 family protein [candidate division NPL-UPA2 bacterium]